MGGIFMDNDKYMLGLSLTDGLNRRLIFKLLEIFHTPQKLWNASKSDLLKCNILREEIVGKIISSKETINLEDEYLKVEKIGGRYISIFNEKFPKLLSEINDPPIGLYIIGELPDEKYLKIAMVGARRCTDYGAMVAEKLSKDLARNKIVIVSGMARGIDSKSHIGAIEGGSKTIAVLGCGIDICYPPENKGLMDKIIKNGCVISEYPLGMPPYANNFPKRNRIISGLCDVTVVVEAEKRSGTLITVNQALDNGRTVFAVPGNITSISSQGTNDLIKDGAPVVTCAEDILSEIGFTNNNQDKKTEYYPEINNLEKDESCVYDCINMTPIDVESIALKINDSIQNVQYILTILEIKGYIRKLPGEKYIREI